MAPHSDAASSSLREQLEAGQAPAGSWVSMASPAAVERVAALDLDFLVVDTEHTALSLETVEALVRAAEAADSDLDVLVRPARNDRTRIKRVLDTGADGVLVPQVNSAEEARDLVEAVRYPPAGSRGIAGTRATDYGANMGEYVGTWNRDAVVLAQVESAEAVEHADEIAAVDGLTGLFVGPADLSGDLGCFGDYEAPEFESAVASVLAAGDDADLPVGTLATSEAEIETWAAAGFDFQIVGTDGGYLVQGANRALERYDETR